MNTIQRFKSLNSQRIYGIAINVRNYYEKKEDCYRCPKFNEPNKWVFPRSLEEEAKKCEPVSYKGDDCRCSTEMYIKKHPCPVKCISKKEWEMQQKKPGFFARLFGKKKKKSDGIYCAKRVFELPNSKKIYPMHHVVHKKTIVGCPVTLPKDVSSPPNEKKPEQQSEQKQEKSPDKPV